MGRAADAVAHLLAVRPECGPLDARYHSTLGTAYWRLGLPTKALAALEAALDLDPEDLIAASEIALEIGDRPKHRQYARRARHLGASEETEEVLRSLREFRKDTSTIHTHLARGRTHLVNRDEDAAIGSLDAVMRLNPSHAGAHFLRGVMLGNRRQWHLMIADMSEVIRIRPDDARAYYNRGMAYGEKDMLDRALADLNEAIHLDPGHADAYRVRGDCLRYQGEYDRAIADSDCALRLDPENAAAYLGRGAACRSKGDPNRAIADYDASLGSAPMIQQRIGSEATHIWRRGNTTGPLPTLTARWDSALTTPWLTSPGATAICSRDNSNSPWPISRQPSGPSQTALMPPTPVA